MLFMVNSIWQMFFLNVVLATVLGGVEDARRCRRARLGEQKGIREGCWRMGRGSHGRRTSSALGELENMEE